MLWIKYFRCHNHGYGEITSQLIVGPALRCTITILVDVFLIGQGCLFGFGDKEEFLKVLSNAICPLLPGPCGGLTYNKNK